MAVAGLGPEGFLARWRMYFHERFPPLKYALAIGTFSSTTLIYAATVTGTNLQSGYRFVVAGVVVLLLFLQLRVLDEFKDAEDDARYRPERPVPRGLVTLSGLARLWLLSAVIQLALVATLGVHSIAWLLATLAYSGLMGVEFFARAWLRRHAVAYLGSHMLIVPLSIGLMLACGGYEPAAIVFAPLLVFGYFNFCVFELGRKICAASEERVGVETYSALWGRKRAVLAWLLVIGAAALAVLLCALLAGVEPAVGVVVAVLIAVASVTGMRFLSDPERHRARLIQSASTVWFLGAQLGLSTALLALT